MRKPSTSDLKAKAQHSFCDARAERNGQLAIRSILSVGSGSTIIQRQCACGGTCPECQEERLKALGVQTSLKINEPGDRWEREADQMADQVLRMSHSQLGEGLAKAPATTVMRRELTQQTPLSSTSNHLRLTGGKPLPPRDLQYFNARFGRDFSKVKIHSNEQADAMSQSLNARAFTSGNNIAFLKGEYDTKSQSGRHLMAHELTHVLQQSHHQTPMIQRAEIDDDPSGCKDLKDLTPMLESLVNGVLATASNIKDGEKRVQAVYEKLGAGSPFSKVEDWTEALSKDYVNRIPIKDTRFGKSSNPFLLIGSPLGKRSGSGVINAWMKGEKAIGALVKVGKVCIGNDKLGHFFQQGRDYFRISVTMGKGDSYAKGFGEWLEGKMPSDPKIAAWIKKMDGESWPGFDSLMLGMSFWKGVFGLSTTGVFSEGDLEANTAGMEFYKQVYNSPQTKFSTKAYLTGKWNERQNPSCFGREMAKVVAVSDPDFIKNNASKINAAYRVYLEKANNTRQGISLSGQDELQKTVARLIAPYVNKYACPGMGMSVPPTPKKKLKAAEQKAPASTSNRRNNRVLDSPIYCFGRGTKVTGPSGLVNIEHLKVGDLIIACDEKSLMNAEAKVVAIHQHKGIVRLLRIEGGEEIRVTDEHPHYVEDRGFVPLKDLRPGDALRNIKGEILSVVKVFALETVFEEDVFNLTVEPHHTYFVGQSQILVHNK